MKNERESLSQIAGALVGRTTHLRQRHRLGLRLGLVALALAAIVVLTTSCKPGDYNNNFDVRVRSNTPEEVAAADKVYAANDAVWKQNEIEFDKAQAQLETYRQTAPGIVLAKSQAEIETIRTDNAAKLETVRADTTAKVAQANASASTSAALGNAAALTLASLGVTLSAVIGMAALYLFAVMAIYVYASLKRNRATQVWTVTAMIGNTRVDYILLTDRDGNVYIQNALTDGRAQISQRQRANGQQARLLLEPARAQAAQQQLDAPHEGVIPAAWRFLFGRKQTRQNVQVIQPEKRSNLEINLQ